MGSLWDAFGGLLFPPSPDDPGGCGLQQAAGSLFRRDRPDEEERHRCILHFPTLRELFTHEEVETIMLQMSWKLLQKRGGWRRFFKGSDPSLPHGVATIAKLPARSFVDAPKHIILDFVRSVNRRENQNVFCCWEHRGQLLVSGWDRAILN